MDTQPTCFARTNFRGDRRLFGIRQADRRAHMYVIGKTGTGKSTLLHTLMRHDLASGQGFALLDPHGDLVEHVRRQVPVWRQPDLTYVNVPDPSERFGFNPLASVPHEKRALAASGLLDVFKKLWLDSWGPRLEYILRNALLALLEQPQATLADVLRLLVDDSYRRQAASRVENLQVRSFWLREYAGYHERLRAEAIAPVQNKVGAFFANPLLARILTVPRSTVDLRQLIDDGKVLLVNLAKGKLGEDTASLLGALLVTSLGWAAFSRADVPEEKRRDFFVYLDEFQNFTTLSLATMLSELRKYRVGLVLAHQYLAQLELPIRDAILGNVGTTIAFRVGAADAELLAQEFYPEVALVDLVSLPNHQIYLRLMVNGVPSAPFSGETLPPAT